MLDRLFNPKSIAVVGASRDPQKIGYQVLDNLLSGFPGRVFAVNPKAQSVLGHVAYKTILDISSSVDLAIICVPEPLVSQVLESCGKKKVKYAVIITAGFSEAGKSGVADEAEILSIAKKFKVRILGPNCLGVINNFTGLNASFATAKLPAKYRVGIFSQSGAMGSAMLDFANGADFGFSYFVSLGNKIDISEVDLIDDWAEDPNVEVAVGYLEDIKDGPGFIAAAQKMTATKPLIILKGGMTKMGGQAAHLHTAAMAQDEKVFEAAMEEAGVILVQNLNDLFDLAVSFSQNHLPRGKNLAVISNAGGPSVLAADAIEKEGVFLAELSPHTISTLSKQTMAASVANPIDLRGDATAKDFRVALELAEKDEAVDGILLIVTPQAMTEVEAIAWEAVRARREGGKSVYVNFIGGELVARGIDICRENGVSTYPYPERAIRSFRFQSEFEKRKRRVKSEVSLHPKHQVAKSILRFSQNGLNPDRLNSLLAVYDIPMAQTFIVKNPDEVAASFAKLHPPVVMKISSPDILHKTDVGGVILGVATAEEASAAYHRILANVERSVPKAKIEGITMMETAKEGLEVIVGAKRDRVFGPILVFGSGGILVELIADFSLVVGPFDESKIRKMISRTKVSNIISGYRKDSKYSEKKLVSILAALGRLITEHQEIASIEINPLILDDDGQGAMGLDAKIELTSKSQG